MSWCCDPENTMHLWLEKPADFTEEQASVITDEVIAFGNRNGAVEIKGYNAYRVKLSFLAELAYGDYYNVGELHDSHTITIDPNPPEEGTIRVDITYYKDKYIDRMSQAQIQDKLTVAIGDIRQFNVILCGYRKNDTCIRDPRAKVLAALADPTLRHFRPKLDRMDRIELITYADLGDLTGRVLLPAPQNDTQVVEVDSFMPLHNR